MNKSPAPQDEEVIAILRSLDCGEITREEADEQLLNLIYQEEAKPEEQWNPQKLAAYEWALYELRTGEPLVTRKTSY